MKLRRFIAGITLLALHAEGAVTADQREFFESRIRPILAQECYECHSEHGKRKGGLLLDSRPGWQEGGDSGKIIVAGDPANSLLLQTLRHELEDLEMPKSGGKLDAGVIEDFEKWVLDGAPDPRDLPPTAEELAEQTDWNAVLERRKQWWAFQPVQKVDTKSNRIDDFIDDGVRNRGLKPVGKASAEVLRRRTSYILTGLPPQEHNVSKDVGHEAYVDALLDSPAFGEKWARHFMDWVRYAESYGSEGDPAIPYAFQYRDYLIRAFNDDVPYPQLVKESIAGDLLATPRIANGINESAIGIGQLRMVLHGFSPVDSLDEMVTFTDNQIDTVTKAFMGLTVSCARCHNHKFDAISQADFYALYGIFTSTHPAVIDANAPGTGEEIRQEMRDVKAAIRTAMAERWLMEVGEESRPDPRDPGDPCYMNWSGMERSAPGAFVVSKSPEGVIERIYPGGYASDLLSDKDRGVIFTSEFKNPGGKVWMRIAGNGGVKAKYVVHNYPRTGTIHKAIELKAPKDESFAWRSLDLDFWKDDEIFLQVTTSADMPAEFKESRSWFALDQTVITANDAKPPEVRISKASPRFLIEAWRDGRITSAGAEALNALLQSGELRNDPTGEVAKLSERYRQLESQLPEPLRVPGVVEGDVSDAALFVQGDHKQPGEIVPRGFLDALEPTPFETDQSGRLELAGRMANLEGNPLTARVIVNRLWHHVFGRGIVASVDNFGKLGDLPTHPELLDFLARRFMESGGSIKALLKEMVVSEAFQRRSEVTSASQEKDPENLLLSHWTLRRLEAEAIRDSILSLSGTLDPSMYGESIRGSVPRRSVYVRVIRNALDPFLTTFDAPVPFMTRGRRDATNVPAQSLTLLNDPAVIRWTQDWSERTASIVNDQERVRTMFVEALGRQATSQEVTQSLAYVAEMEKEGQTLVAELKRRNEEVEMLTEEIAGTLEPARQKLREVRGAPTLPDGVPKAFAEWTFEEGLGDSNGRLPMQAVGNARVKDGALIMDGASMVRSKPLSKRIKAKTLEAWVMLDDLKQRGGGVVTVQDTKGGVFDSLVFAEKSTGHWVAGSDHFNRGDSFDGIVETEADKRPVHVAVVYQGDGTITGYREGKPYGRTYRKAPGVAFEAGASEVLLGCRHGSPSGNRGLKGRIYRARLYDRALTAQDIAKSSKIELASISDDEVLESLPKEAQLKVAALKAKRLKASQALRVMQPEQGPVDPEADAWASLAQSIINLKEFIYLR